MRMEWIIKTLERFPHMYFLFQPSKRNFIKKNKEMSSHEQARYINFELFPFDKFEMSLSIL